MNRKKYIAIGAFIIALASGGVWLNLPHNEPKNFQEFFGKPEYESVDIKKPLAEQTVIVEIASRTFKIPKVYIQTNLGGKRNQDDGINLLYVMPDFTSMLDFKNKAEYDQAFNDRRMAHMLIKSSKQSTLIYQIINNRKKNGDLTKYEGKHYGLEKYIDYDDPRHLNIRYDDTYLELDEKGNVISFLSCDPEEKGYFPGCSHIFVDNGIYYDIYFNKKKYLSTWQEHRRKAIAFINSFEIKDGEK